MVLEEKQAHFLKYYMLDEALSDVCFLLEMNSRGECIFHNCKDLQKNFKTKWRLKKILQKMKWQPKYNNLELICQSTYTWEKTNG